MHAAPALPELQRRFLAAIYDDGALGPVEAIAGHGLEPSARLRIYRHSGSEIHTSALRVMYPAVLALVGAAFFDQTARGYRSTYPSDSGNLQKFGAQFAEYLQSLPATRELSYLPDIARLEWLRQRAALAADADTTLPATFVQLPAQAGVPRRIGLHPSVQWLASRYPVLTIWRYATDPTPDDLQLTDKGEQVVLWRESGEVAMATLDAASLACIEALAIGDTLDHAYATAKSLDIDFDLPACVTSLAERGLIVALGKATPDRRPAPCQ
ncbi:MAG: HvfC/BufC family peptide modification chaperone [Rhodanobacteraceae bacterium]